MRYEWYGVRARLSLSLSVPRRSQRSALPWTGESMRNAESYGKTLSSTPLVVGELGKGSRRQMSRTVYAAAVRLSLESCSVYVSCCGDLSGRGCASVSVTGGVRAWDCALCAYAVAPPNGTAPNGTAPNGCRAAAATVATRHCRDVMPDRRRGGGVKEA